MRKLLCAFVLCATTAQLQAQDTIRKSEIPVVAKFADLSFTQQEIDSMFDGVKENVFEIRKMHKYPLSNSTPMSMWQSPVVAGMQFDMKQQPINWEIPANVALPANRNELAFYSVMQLASLIKNKKISSVELTKFFIERIRKYGDTLQCVISVTEEIAMQQAKEADALIAKGKYKGPLHGIPYGLKDLFAVKGTKTTWGAAPYKDQIIDEDATVYNKLRDAGAVLVAKFTLGALAMGDRWYGGRTNNPWNLRFGSSGSSAGSASATVAGLVPFAIGTETWGSIISPSSTCGATGFRPTFGRVSRAGGMTLSWSLDKVGPITRSAEDAALVFSFIHGADNKDLSAVSMPFNYQPKGDVKKLKVGYAKNYFDRITDTSRNEWKVLDAYRKMGVELVPIVFPDSGVYNFNVMDIVISAECAAAFDDFTRTGLDDQMTWQNKFDWPNSFRVSRLIPAVEYINANRHRYLLMQQVNATLKDIDVLICPTRGSGSQSAITNLTGHPAICMPTGFDKRFNTPTSITLLGKLYGEAAMLTAAKTLQQATSWDDVHPPMFQ
ncbi:MAG: amidase [Chitinophagaceae bacterium]|nr:amidase [Chitinophagaceae bacterium]